MNNIIKILDFVLSYLNLYINNRNSNISNDTLLNNFINEFNNMMKKTSELFSKNKIQEYHVMLNVLLLIMENNYAQLKHGVRDERMNKFIYILLERENTLFNELKIYEKYSYEDLKNHMKNPHLVDVNNIRNDHVNFILKYNLYSLFLHFTIQDVTTDLDLELHKLTNRNYIGNTSDIEICKVMYKNDPKLMELVLHNIFSSEHICDTCINIMSHELISFEFIREFVKLGLDINNKINGTTLLEKMKTSCVDNKDYDKHIKCLVDNGAVVC